MKSIKVYKTDYDDNYILYYNNKTLKVGYIVVKILEYLKDNVNKSDIKDKIHNELGVLIDDDDVIKVINKLNDFIFNKKKDFFLRICKFINPNKYNIFFPDILFNKTIYILIFSTLFILNVCYFFFATNTMLLSSNFDIIYYYLILILILVTHEFGHVLSSKYFGVNVDEIGLGLYIIFPVLYTDLGEVWRLHKYKRLIINLSGLYFQLLISVILLLLVFITNYSFIHKLINVNFIIILINLNPFIKFDGYWILIDLFNKNNISQKSNFVIKNFIYLKFPKDVFIFVYSIFKLIFLIFIVFYISSFLYELYKKILNNLPFETSDYLLILIILLIIYKKIKK
jgi:putative peptide zinc metalloprotease protein